MRICEVMRRRGRLLTITAGIFATLALASAPARAVEPRPWLCRDKPVFSSDQPMTWTATQRGGGRWVMNFMRFDPAGGHDGFTVYDTRRIEASESGALDPGQWYVVGMYREGGHWICAARAGENHQFTPGVVRDLCYGESEGACAVKMVVRARAAGGAAGHN